MATIEDLEKQAADAEAEAKAAEMPEAERREVEVRARIAAAQALKSSRIRERTALDLDRREDAARLTLGAKIPVTTLMDDTATGEMHSFVLRYAGTRAFSAWENGIAMSHLGSKDPTTRKRVERDVVNKSFAMSLVYDWNGTIIEPKSDASVKLADLFDAFGGIASQVALAGRGLSGAAMEERKSGG